MTEQTIERIASALEAIAQTLTQLEMYAGQMVVAANPAPNITKPLAAFAGFDFSTIGATVVQEDQHGPSSLEWNGRLFTRRSPQNKFGEAIWFSRSAGQDAEGNRKYETLIRFKDYAEADPLPRKVSDRLDHAGRSDSGRQPEPDGRANGHAPAPASSQSRRPVNAAAGASAPSRPVAVGDSRRPAPPAGQQAAAPAGQGKRYICQGGLVRVLDRLMARLKEDAQATQAVIDARLVEEFGTADLTTFPDDQMRRALGALTALADELEHNLATAAGF